MPRYCSDSVFGANYTATVQAYHIANNKLPFLYVSTQLMFHCEQIYV